MFCLPTGTSATSAAWAERKNDEERKALRLRFRCSSGQHGEPGASRTCGFDAWDSCEQLEASARLTGLYIYYISMQQWIRVDDPSNLPGHADQQTSNDIDIGDIGVHMCIHVSRCKNRNDI